MKRKAATPHSDAFVNEIIRMAWADDVSFERIKRERGLSESEVIALMRRHLKPSSFKCWRARVSGRASKPSKRTAMRHDMAYS
jgi:uncharacterized protein (TIGR03643 family)